MITDNEDERDGGGRCGVSDGTRGCDGGFFPKILPLLVQRGGGYATTCTEKSGKWWKISVNQSSI